MTLLQTALIGALGYAGYRYYQKRKEDRHAAFATGEAGTIRNAGPEAMADSPRREWTQVDEESDESFPASDPPANY